MSHILMHAKSFIRKLRTLPSDAVFKVFSYMDEKWRELWHVIYLITIYRIAQQQSCQLISSAGTQCLIDVLTIQTQSLLLALRHQVWLYSNQLRVSELPDLDSLKLSL